MNQGEQYYPTVNINYDYILSTTTTTTTITSSTSTKPTSNGTSTTTNEMDGTRRVGREWHCSTVPTTTVDSYADYYIVNIYAADEHLNVDCHK